MSFLLWAGILIVGQLLAQRFLFRPHAKLSNTTPTPDGQADQPIRTIIGTQVITPAIAFWGNTRQRDGDKNSTEYYARMVLWLSMGPLTRILDLQWGDRSLALHPATRASNDEDLSYVISPPFPLTRLEDTAAATQAYIYAHDFFGGPKGGGGVAGPIRVHWGMPTDAVDALVTENFQSPGGSEASAWPRYAYLTLGASASGGPYPHYDDLLEDGYFYHGSNIPTPQDLRVVAQHIHTGLLDLDLDPGYTSAGLTYGERIAAASVGFQDCNPAEALFLIATDPVLGCGYATDDMELATFVALAKTCRGEQLGVSLLIDGSMSGLDLFDDILRQIDGVRYDDPTTGKLAVMLLRNDYVLAEQVELRPDNTRDVQLRYMATGNQANELRASFSQYESGAGMTPVVGEVLTEDLIFGTLGLLAILQCAGRNITDVHLYYDDGSGPVEIAPGDHWHVNSGPGIIVLGNDSPAHKHDRITVDYVGSAQFIGYRAGLTAPMQNQADILATGVVRQETVDLPYLTTERNANIALARAMTRVVRRLPVLEWYQTRDAWSLHVGSVVRANYPRHALADFAVRVTRIEEAELEDGSLHCWGVEDLFAKPINPLIPTGGGSGETSTVRTAPAMAISCVSPGAFRVGLFASDPTFTIRLYVADSDLGLGVITGATLISEAIAGSTAFYDYLDGVDPWADGTTKYFAAQLIRMGWEDGPLTPWMSCTASSGTPGAPAAVIPTWTTSKSETSTTGTATLTVTDPQDRLQLVEAKTKVGTAAESAYATLGAIPYSQAVAFSGTLRSTVTFRVTYLAADGSTVVVEVPVDFDAPVLMSLAAQFDGAGNLVANYAHSGGSIRIAGAINATPADATVDAVTASNTSIGTTGTLATATTAGDTGTVKAVAYSGAGGTGRKTAYVTVSAVFGSVGGAGAGSSTIVRRSTFTFILPHAEAGSWQPWPVDFAASIVEVEAQNEDGTPFTGALKLERSTDAAFGIWADLTGGHDVAIAAAVRRIVDADDAEFADYTSGLAAGDTLRAAIDSTDQSTGAVVFTVTTEDELTAQVAVPRIITVGGTLRTVGEVLRQPIDADMTIQADEIQGGPAGLTATIEVSRSTDAAFGTWTKLGEIVLDGSETAARRVDETLTGWTIALIAGDTLEFRLTAASVAGDVSGWLTLRVGDASGVGGIGGTVSPGRIPVMVGAQTAGNSSLEDSGPRIASDKAIDTPAREVTADDAATVADHILVCRGTLTLTLPAVEDMPYGELIVINDGADTVTVAAAGTDLVAVLDGEAATKDLTQGEVLTLRALERPAAPHVWRAV